MKELNRFRQFINESKENVDELFGMGRKSGEEEMAMKVMNAIEIVDDLVEAGHLDQSFFESFSEKMAMAYDSVMRGASPELQSKMGFETGEVSDEEIEDELASLMEGEFGNDPESRYNYIRPLMVDLDDTARTEAMIDGMEDAMMDDDKEAFDFYFVETMKMLGLEDQLMENDKVLDEVLNEAKPNLKRALPTIAARNVERNNAINFDIEEMMDMVGEAGKDQNSEEAQILFRASNASEELETALTDLQMHFEDYLGEGKEALNEDDFKKGDKVTMKQGGEEMEIVSARRMFGSSTEAYKVKKADGKTVEYSANQLKKA